MNKRDTIIVIFRVVAIFVLFSMIALAPAIFGDRTWSAIFSVVIPILVALLLWNKSSWLADKIVIPFQKDISWDDSSEKRFSRTEIESIAFKIIGIFMLVFAIPSLIDYIIYIGIKGSITFPELVVFISPVIKLLFGLFLLFKSNRLSKKQAEMQN